MAQCAANMETTPFSAVLRWRAVVQVAALAVMFTACTSAPPFDAETMVKDWMQFMQSDHVIRPGDQLAVTVYQADELTQEVTVAPTGIVHLRRLPKPIRAIGTTVGTFRRQVQEAYAEVLQVAEVSVSLTQASVNAVYVAGEVLRPGPVAYAPGMTLTQSVAAAGGFDITAKDSDVRILRNEPGRAPRTFRVNAEDIFFEQGQDFLVLPGDVVFCQTSGIADVGNWVELYIRRILPFQLTGATVPTGSN